MAWAECVGSTWKRNKYRIVVVKHGKRQYGRTRSKWEDSVQWDLRRICLRM